MTKEELKKEFEKYLKDSADYYDPREPLTERKLLQMWLDCAEPREKRIAELEEISTRLESYYQNQKVRIAELEAQIEKMKLCQICKHYQWESCSYHSLWEKDCKANNHKLFELVGDKRK